MLNDLSFRAMESSLKGLKLQQDAILHNISNLETPGYKTKNVTFDNVLEQARQGNAGRYDFKAIVQEDAYTEARPDGNNVDIDQENVELVGSYFQTLAIYQKLGSKLSDYRYVIGQAFK